MSDFKNKIQATLNQVQQKAENSDGVGFSEEAIEEITALSPKIDQVTLNEVQAEIEDQKMRALAQGLTFGFADELEAFGKALLNKDVTYEQARDEIRTKVSQYQEAKPGESLAIEIAGAVVPTVASLFGGPAGWAKAMQTITQLGTKLAGRKSIGEVAHLSGKQGAAYSVGTGEEGIVEDLKNAPGGYVAGATLGTVIQGGGQLATEGMSRLLSTEIGKKYSPVVREQMQMLIDKTGLTAQQVIDQVKQGKLVIDNATLRAAIKALTGTLGDAGQTITDVAKRRPIDTRKDLLDQMQMNVNRTKSEVNVQELYRLSDDALRENESKLYKTLFKDINPQLPSSLAKNLEGTMQMFPQMFDELNAIYRSTPGNLVPFYEIGKNGALKIIRSPSLEDAEIVYRALRDTPRMNVNKTLLSNMDQAVKDLKKQIDDFSPDLKFVREQAKQTRVGRDAFLYGETLLGINPEKVALEIKKFEKTPGAMDALRQGFMSTYKFRSQTPQTIKSTADETKAFNKIVQLVFPEGQADDLIARARVAGDAVDTKNSIIGGTTTSREQTAIDQMTQAAALARFKQNPTDIASGITVVKNMISNRAPNINAKDAQDIAELVTTKDFKLLQQALVDESKLPLFVKILDSAIYGASRTAASGTAKLGGDQVQEDLLSSSGLMDYVGSAVSDSIGNLMQQN